ASGPGWPRPRRPAPARDGRCLAGHPCTERLVLKRGRPEQDEADVTWEHDYLRRLAEAGFPASVPMPALDGQSWVCVDGRIWAVLSYLPGHPLASASSPDMKAAGAFLARYHQ